MSRDGTARLKIGIKRALAACYRPFADQRRGVRVLAYHTVGGNSPRSQSRESFVAQMQFLRESAEVVGIDRLQAGEPGSVPRVLLTFDDGYRDAVDVVAPILEEFGFGAIFFVPTGLIGGDYSPSRAHEYGLAPGLPLVTWDDISALHRAGMTIGSHTHRHVDLARCGLQKTREEIATSVTALRTRLHERSVVFAYPWGQLRQLTPVARQSLSENDVRLAFSTVAGPVTQRSDPLALPRIVIDAHDSLADFRAKVQGSWDYMRWVHRSAVRGVA